MAILLEELALPYEIKSVEMNAVKKEPFISVNPNGRVPAIEDPNTGVTLWESGAILQYLSETYDKELRFTYNTVPEKYQLMQWLMFQMSGQGPYFGQYAWFTYFHPEKLPSVQERYMKEIERVTGVLDAWLQKHEFLVGDKLTYVDLAFVPWAGIASSLDKEGEKSTKEKFPAFSAWFDKMSARPSVKKIMSTEI